MKMVVPDDVLEKYIRLRVLHYNLGVELIQKPFWVDKDNNIEMYERFRTAFNELESVKSAIEVATSGSNFNEIIQRELELYKGRVQETRDTADRIYKLECKLAELKNPLSFIYTESLAKMAAECDELELCFDYIEEGLRLERMEVKYFYK